MNTLQYNTSIFQRAQPLFGISQYEVKHIQRFPHQVSSVRVKSACPSRRNKLKSTWGDVPSQRGDINTGSTAGTFAFLLDN